MSEDDRAAKAARAKALLKKRQQKKAADIVAIPSLGVASPIIPPRTFSPALSEPVEDGRDLGDIFSKDTPDSSWLSSLPRIASPPPPPHPQAVTRVATSPPAASVSFAKPSHSPPASNALQAKLETLSEENERLVITLRRLEGFESAAQQAEDSFAAERKRVEELTENLQKLQDYMEISLRNEHQTVSLLVTEKAHLTAELQKREDFESKAQDLEDELETERAKSENLSSEIQNLQKQVSEVLSRAELSEAKERELVVYYREQERQLKITSSSASEFRKEADESRRKLRELEEQIQSDDRVERLETSLKHTQDRADELEFQLTKLKQAHTSLKSERDLLESKVAVVSTEEAKWDTQKSVLGGELSDTHEKLISAEKQRDESLQENRRLHSLVESQETSIKEHQEKLIQASSALATINRQLQSTQNELRAVNRRADDAEKIQHSLQGEGTNLMRALDEMRPKIIELTGAKLELVERVENLERTIRNRDSVIVQLENDLEDAREMNGETEVTWKERVAEQEKRLRETQTGASDIQKAYISLQEELDTALASLRNLETQRTNSHQEAARRLEEIERFKDQSQTQGEELDALRHEVEARRKAYDEEQDFLDRTQNEIEILRAELNARDDEIEHLRETVNSPSMSAAPRSLDDEMLGSIRQQHAMEISAATSQIRALENMIFDKDSINHKLQKQLNALEEQLTQPQSSSRRPFSPVPLENVLRRSSFRPHRTNPTPLSRSIFDHNISPETMHKRKVSLSMLKARIDSEVKTTFHSQPPSPVHSESGSQRSSIIVPHYVGPHHHIHRPQFLDESHVFWCHSCHGDLVIL